VIQGSEFFIILLVALVVMGPQRLPEMARKVGQWTAELRRTAADLRAGLEAEVSDFQEISRELKAPLGDITTVAKDTAEAANTVAKPVSPGGPTIQRAPATERPAGATDGGPLAWTGPRPASGPTPEDALADLDQIERSGEPISGEPAPSGQPSGQPLADTSQADPAPDPADEVDDGHADDAVSADRRGGGPSAGPPHEATG
jgi:sec-independent protein translocase protein TatB